MQDIQVQNRVVFRVFRAFRVKELNGLKGRAAREDFPTNKKKTGEHKHTTVRIRMWSPTILLTNRRVA
jgi:hypothetical protein